jgi:hypothetical protein
MKCRVCYGPIPPPIPSRVVRVWPNGFKRIPSTGRRFYCSLECAKLAAKLRRTTKPDP